MRGLILSACLTITAVSAFHVTPAAARDYAYCVQGREIGYPGDCSFTSYEQCQASASGRDAACGVNPVVAFAQRYGNGGASNDSNVPRRRYGSRRTYDGSY